MREGLLAEFETPEALVSAIHGLREKGYRELEAYTPYIVIEAEEALEIRRSRLPYAIFIGGVFGAGAAYFLQWFLNAYLYPLDVGGRPPHMPLAFIPITFEMGVLFASFTAFFGVLVRSRLGRLWDPVFEVPGFTSASIDRFWLEVRAKDPAFDVERTARHLRDQGARRVERFGKSARAAKEPT